MPICGTHAGPLRAAMTLQNLSYHNLSGGLMQVQQQTPAAPLGGACLIEAAIGLQLQTPLETSTQQAHQTECTAGAQSGARRQVQRCTTWPKQRMMSVIHEDGLHQCSNTTLADDGVDQLQQALCAATVQSAQPQSCARAATSIDAFTTHLAVSSGQAVSAAMPPRSAAAVPTAWALPAHSSSSSGSGSAVAARRRGVIKRQTSATTGRELVRSAGVKFADQVSTNLSGRRRSLGTAYPDVYGDELTAALPELVPAVACAAGTAEVLVGLQQQAPTAMGVVGQRGANPDRRLPKRRASAPHLGLVAGAVSCTSAESIPGLPESAHSPSCQCTVCVCAQTAQLVHQLMQQQQQQGPSQPAQLAASGVGLLAHQHGGQSPQVSPTAIHSGGHWPGVYQQVSAAVQGSMAHQGSAGHHPGVQAGLLPQRSLSPGLGSAGQLLQGSALQQQGSLHAGNNGMAPAAPSAQSHNSSPVPAAVMSPLSMISAVAPSVSNVGGSAAGACQSASMLGQRHLAQSMGMMTLSNPAASQRQEQLHQQQQAMMGQQHGMFSSNPAASQQLLALQRQRRQQLALLQQQQQHMLMQLQQQQQQQQQQSQLLQLQQQQQQGRQRSSTAATVLAAARSNPEQVLGMLLQKAQHIALTPSQLEKLQRVLQLKQKLATSKALLTGMSAAPAHAAAAAPLPVRPDVLLRQQQQQQGLYPPSSQQPCNLNSELHQPKMMAQAEASTPHHHQQQQGAAAWSSGTAAATAGGVAAMWQQSAAAVLDHPPAAATSAPLLNGSNFLLQQQLSGGPSLLSQGSTTHGSLLQQGQEQPQVESGGFGSFTALQDPQPAAAAAEAAVAAAPTGAVDSQKQMADLVLGDLDGDLIATLDLNALDIGSFGGDDELIGFVGEILGTDETFLSVQAKYTQDQQRQEKLKLYEQQVEKYKQLQQQQPQQQQQVGGDAFSSQAESSAAAAAVACARGSSPGAADAVADAADWMDQLVAGLADMEHDILGCT